MNCNGLQILFLLTTFVCLSQCAKIYLFEISYTESEPVVIHLQDGVCFNLSDVGMAYRVSAIDSNDYCVHLCDRADCKGLRLKVAPGTKCHWDLGQCGNNFDKKAVSIILCENQGLK